jgi:hypothetical protein
VISWIVASNDYVKLGRNLLASMCPRDSVDRTTPAEADARLSRLTSSVDEILVVWHPDSIGQAYNLGTRSATHRVRCYVHHDVEVLDVPALRTLLLDHCWSGVGMVGVMGCRQPAVPWWAGEIVGSVIDSRFGALSGDEKGGPCAYLDGLLLATAHDVVWDESYPGFHGYDHDVCQQMLARGLANYCLPGGQRLVRHNTRGPVDLGEVDGWAAAVDRFHAKWADVPVAAA